MSNLSSQAAPDTPVAVIGCGAIAETFYLPALVQVPRLAKSLVLVDSNRERAAALGAKFGMTNTAGDYRDIIGGVRGAIVAVPHHLHYAISSDFLKAGVHVLCEKPLSETPDRVRDLVALADQHKATIAVNNSRRFYPSSIAVNDLIRSGAIGAIKSITYLDGFEFDWPSASGFYFDSRISKKGILLDMGAHVVDLFCWWLGEKPRLETSENDSFGGVEAVSSASFSWSTGKGSLFLSRLAKLVNTYTIQGEAGTIVGEVYDMNSITLTKEGKSSIISCKQPAGRNADIGIMLMENLLAVIDGVEKPLVAGADVLPSIELIDEAYSRAKRFPMPWYQGEGASR
jgi:predicted dehydrogenase